MERLKRRAEFLKVQKGRRSHSGLFSVQSLACDGGSNPRVGFTVSKRVSVKATVRNRIRRRLKEAAKLSWPVTGGHAIDYVIVAKPEALTASFSRITDELSRCFAQARKAGERSSRPETPAEIA